MERQYPNNPNQKRKSMPDDTLSPRLQREWKTITAMQQIYCHAHHGIKNGLCPDCTRLSAYALERLKKCLFQDAKPTCAKCPIHCYRKDMREEVRTIMRFSGPRILLRHPLLALLHLLDGLRKAPPRLH
jgi:hypothetical protein